MSLMTLIGRTKANSSTKSTSPRSMKPSIKRSTCPCTIDVAARSRPGVNGGHASLRLCLWPTGSVVRIVVAPL
jgi:hypothetical protein